METVLMIIWFITAPIMLWSRFFGPVLLFNIIAIVNTLIGMTFLILEVKD